MKGIAILPILASIMILGVIGLQEADSAKMIWPKNTTIRDDVFIPAEDTWIVKPGATLTLEGNTVRAEGDIVVERDATLFQDDDSLLEILGGSFSNDGLWNITDTSKVRNDDGRINNLAGGILNVSGSMDVFRSGVVNNNFGGVIVIDGTMDILRSGVVNNNDDSVILNFDAVIVQRTGTLNNNERAVYFNNGTFILSGDFNNDGKFFDDLGDTIDVSGARGVGIIADRDTDRIFIFNQDKELLELSQMIIGLDSIEETKKTEPFEILISAFLPLGGIFNILAPTDLPDDDAFSISIKGDSIIQDPTRGDDPVKKKFKSKTMIK